MRERGRIRRRPSGGGTLRRKSPQHEQRPSLATGPVTSARSQWPRSSHIGLMHCTVKPGKYCIVSPQWPHKPDNSAAENLEQACRWIAKAPWRPCCSPRSPEGERLARGSAAQTTDRGPRGNSELDGAHSAPNDSGCQGKNTTRYCGKVAAVKNVIFTPKFRGIKGRRPLPAPAAGNLGRRREMGKRISTY